RSSGGTTAKSATNAHRACSALPSAPRFGAIDSSRSKPSGCVNNGSLVCYGNDVETESTQHPRILTSIVNWLIEMSGGRFTFVRCKFRHCLLWTRQHKVSLTSERI